MGALIKLPNIGAVLEERLNEVGIETPEQLREVGTEAVFLRLRERDHGACLHALCALEGAVRGVRKAERIL